MTSRSRHGCATCRKRKKKCDEGKPECGQCVARGVRCGGYDMKLTWSNAIASRGRFAGTTFAFPNMTPMEAPPVQATSSPGSTTTDAARIGIMDHSHASVVATTQHDSPQSAITGSSLSPNWDEQASQARSEKNREGILKKFLNEGIHRLYASTASESIVEAFKDLIPTSEVLRLVCVALQEVISTGPTVSALEKTGRALEMFRHEVSSENLRNQEELFMAGSWICTLHLIQGLPWTSTFYQFLEFCHIGDDLSKLRPNPRYHLGVRQQMETISVLDFPNFVLGRVSPSRGLWKRFRNLQSSWDDRYDEGIEPVTGLPRTMLDLLAPDSLDSEEDIREREERLWNWVGQTSSSLWFGQLWDCYRYAGILAIRHQRSLVYRSLHPGGVMNINLHLQATSGTSKVPPTDIVLFRLLSSLNAVLNERYYPCNHASLQVQHLALYPLVYASLQVSTLKATKHPWWEDLKRMRDQIMALEPAAQKHTLLLFEILDEAWDWGSDGFDADEAARRREVEITII